LGFFGDGTPGVGVGGAIDVWQKEFLIIISLMFKHKLTAMGYNTDTKEWFELFDKYQPKIKWFIDQYFPGTMLKLRTLRKLGTKHDQRQVIDMLSDIWFKLPDSKFNIMEDPPGWTEFLELIED